MGSAPHVQRAQHILSQLQQVAITTVPLLILCMISVFLLMFLILVVLLDSFICLFHLKY
jgi:hypothetical protein